MEESPIQAVMDAAAFWKFVGKNVGNLPFIKKKVEGFSFLFTVYSGLRVARMVARMYDWYLSGMAAPVSLTTVAAPMLALLRI